MDVTKVAAVYDYIIIIRCLKNQMNLDRQSRVNGKVENIPFKGKHSYALIIS